MQKIEKKLNSVKNLSSYKSISSSNVGVLSAEFKK
jgi:multidrug efflux pump subunit AcrB